VSAARYRAHYWLVSPVDVLADPVLFARDVADVMRGVSEVWALDSVTDGRVPGDIQLTVRTSELYTNLVRIEAVLPEVLPGDTKRVAYTITVDPGVRGTSVTDSAGRLYVRFEDGWLCPAESSFVQWYTIAECGPVVSLSQLST
jgi:hypothetical protein